ncbi:MAG: sulfatase-like hydrolase/transferase [Caldilineaceae bacterium]
MLATGASTSARCTSVPAMRLAAFTKHVVVENPTNKDHALGGADDDWGRYLTFHGQSRPNDRHLTDPDWRQKHQGVPWHLEERFHSDVFIGDTAVSWIDSYKGNKPLFLMTGFTGPHEPWDPLPRHLAMYKDRPLPRRVHREGELAEKPPQHAALMEVFANANHESMIDLSGASEDDIVEMRRHYYAKITTVDEQIGRVLDALERRGWLEESLIILCSDHGEMLGDHGLIYKWLMYDPIVHIPLIIRRPGSAGQPSSVTDLVSLMDLGPTILSAAGLDVPDYLEGRSLLPYLADDAVEPREFVFCEDNYQIMMRSARHKLVYYIGQEAGELYDLVADPNELHNLWNVPAHKDTRDSLQQRLLSWLAGSVYYNAGYRQNRARHTNMRWPREGDAYLQGNNLRPKQVDFF